MIGCQNACEHIRKKRSKSTKEDSFIFFIFLFICAALTTYSVLAAQTQLYWERETSCRARWVVEICVLRWFILCCCCFCVQAPSEGCFYSRYNWMPTNAVIFHFSYSAHTECVIFVQTGSWTALLSLFRAICGHYFKLCSIVLMPTIFQMFW